MAMIQTTLELIREKLNDRLMAEDRRSEDWVILSNIVGLNGEPFPEARDKVVICLANIQSEEVTSAYLPGAAVGSAGPGLVALPLYIDLFVLFYANFEGRNYPEGLGVISRTIAFFQENPVFTRDNLPMLDGRIDKLQFEFTNLDLAALHCLLRYMGAKYLPSAYYKVRMIRFDDGNG
jgi:hypothetical protein